MKLSYILVICAFLVVIAINLALAQRVSRLAYDVERLNAAYGEALESLRAITELVETLPERPAEDE